MRQKQVNMYKIVQITALTLIIINYSSIQLNKNNQMKNQVSKSVHVASSFTDHDSRLQSYQHQSIRLSQLRSRRKQIEQKVKLVSNRINFRRKKDQSQLKKYIRHEEKARVLSETKKFKKFQDLIIEQMEQKRQFETQKKIKDVQQFRSLQTHRLQIINQALLDRNHLQSQKVRRSKRNGEELKTSAKHISQLQTKEKHQEILKMKERQQQKKRHYWYVEKKLNFQQNMIEQAQIYEKQIQDFHSKIQMLQIKEEKLRVEEEHANEVLRFAQQNYQLLKKA